MSEQILIIKTESGKQENQSEGCLGDQIKPAPYLIEQLKKGKSGYVLVLNCKTSLQVDFMTLGEWRFDQGVFRLSGCRRICQKLMIWNLCACLDIDIEHDFDKIQEQRLEHSREICQYLSVLLKEPYKHPGRPEIYQTLNSEVYQHPLSQRNEYCQRIYSSENQMEGRSEFQRDYDRIVHAKAFRRLVDKAQIFSSSKGESYRTRMTHTLVVVQIAKGISNPLGLNIYLTEAIAMGHDLGHTPFGHQGERTLHDIMTGKISVLPELNGGYQAYGGFKHNYQSLRVVSTLEETYLPYNGLNLSFQTLEGMWKHTKIKAEYDITDFFSESYIKKLHPEIPFCTNLEGQVVAIADEIAQRSHDLDDAFTAGLITLEDLEHYLELNEMEGLLERLLKNRNDFENYRSQNRMFSKQDELMMNRAASVIIRYFIEDVINASQEEMEGYPKDGFDTSGHVVDRPLIRFSEKGRRLCDYLEKIVSKKVINCPEVILFDAKASRIVEGLFRSYYENPRLLSQEARNRIFTDFRSFTCYVPDIINGDPDLIREEWRMITKKSTELCKELVLTEMEIEEYDKKRKILVRTICDVIADMTDSRAVEEYHRLFG